MAVRTCPLYFSEVYNVYVYRFISEKSTTWLNKIKMLLPSRGREFHPRHMASGYTQDFGHRLFQYGSPGWWIKYLLDFAIIKVTVFFISLGFKMVSLRGQKKPGSLPDWSPLRAKITDEHPSPVYPSGSLSYCNTTPSRVTLTLSLVNLCLFTPSWVRKFEYSPSLLPSNLVGSCKANQLCLKSFKFLVDLLKFLPSVSVFE